jgi:hypothetical protein
VTEAEVKEKYASWVPFLRFEKTKVRIIIELHNASAIDFIKSGWLTT